MTLIWFWVERIRSEKCQMPCKRGLTAEVMWEFPGIDFPWEQLLSKHHLFYANPFCHWVDSFENRRFVTKSFLNKDKWQHFYQRHHTVRSTDGLQGRVDCRSSQSSSTVETPLERQPVLPAVQVVASYHLVALPYNRTTDISSLRWRPLGSGCLANSRVPES